MARKEIQPKQGMCGGCELSQGRSQITRQQGNMIVTRCESNGLVIETSARSLKALDQAALIKLNNERGLFTEVELVSWFLQRGDKDAKIAVEHVFDNIYMWS